MRASRQVMLMSFTLAFAFVSFAPIAAAEPKDEVEPLQPKAAEGNEAIKAPPKVNPGPSANELETWRQAIVHTKRPRKACLTAKYPATAWTEVPCIKPPNTPFLRAKGIRPLNVGNGTDFSAQPASGLISEADGSFDQVTGVTSEFMLLNGKQSPGVFSLQLNTQIGFPTSACGQVSGCTGWQQFIFSNGGCGGNGSACAYIQSWLFGFGSTCPSGWSGGFGGLSYQQRECGDIRPDRGQSIGDRETHRPSQQ
jgi:hypothetical protein